MKRDQPRTLDLLGGSDVDLWPFSTGDAAKILGVKVWRLQKFLDTALFHLPQPRLTGSGGLGSRRQFSRDDLYRIAVAARLNRHGFDAKLIGQIMAELKDRKLIEDDDRGEEATWGFTLSDSSKGPKLDFFPSGKPPGLEVGGSVYYALDVGQVIEEVNRRIMAAKNG